MIAATTCNVPMTVWNQHHPKQVIINFYPRYNSYHSTPVVSCRDCSESFLTCCVPGNYKNTAIYKYRLYRPCLWINNIFVGGLGTGRKVRLTERQDTNVYIVFILQLISDVNTKTNNNKISECSLCGLC